MADNCPTEDWEQQCVVDYCDWHKIPCFHIPNGGERHKAVAVHMKRQGVKPGVPDLCIPLAKGGYHGLYIEMKRQKSYRISNNQTAWIKLLRKNGYAAFVCAGSESAIKCIDWYLEQ